MNARARLLVGWAFSLMALSQACGGSSSKPDQATATQAPSPTTTPTPAPTATPTPAPSPTSLPKSGISGLPLPGTGAEGIPAGAGCDLTVLSWAGFAGAASYTFDDGQPSQIAHWQELKATGIPMTFYLNKNNGTSGFEATWKDALLAGYELGNHTYSHNHLPDYAGDAARAKDITDASDYIENTLGQSTPCSFAYPFGEVGWDAFFNDKFLFARTVYSGTIKPLDNTDPLKLPIFPVLASQTESDFNPVLDTSAKEKSWVIFMFHSILPGDNWYAGVTCDAVVKSLDHGKTSGNLWMDTVERVGSYWLAQKLFASLQPQGDTSTKHWTWSLPARFPRGQYLRVRVTGRTLSQNGQPLSWNAHGFYEISLDSGSLDWHA